MFVIQGGRVHVGQKGQGRIQKRGQIQDRHCRLPEFRLEEETL